MSETLQDDDARSSRDQILDAAERVVEAEGSGRLTIDAVVKESGFSKGGVLYHFSSKYALIEGMIQRVAQSVEADACAFAQDMEGDDCAVLPAILKALLNKERDKSRVKMGLLAAIAEHPELVQPVRDVIDRVKKQTADHSTDTELAQILVLAADGINMTRMMGLDVLTDEERARVEARMLAMAKEISL